MSLSLAKIRTNALAALAYGRFAWSRKLGPSSKMSRTRDAFYERTWRDAAHSIGAELFHSDGLFQVTRNGITTFVWKNYTQLDDPVTLRLAGNKPFVSSKLKSENIPTADHCCVTLDTLQEAWPLLEGRQCVVKPAKYTGAGSGITTSVRNHSDLERAACVAAALDREIMVEEQIDGDNYRLLFLEGQYIETIRRDPPCVIGNGTSTLKQLIRDENKLRQARGWHRAQCSIEIDDDLKNAISGQGLTLGSRPRDGERIRLKTVINQNRAAENHVVHDVCPHVVSICQQAVQSIGIRLAGIDIVTPDIHQPLDQVGGVVLEVNTTPGLYHHYDPAEDRCRVSTQLLEACLAEARRRSQLLTSWERSQ